MKRLVVVMILVASQMAFCQGTSREDPYAEKLVASFISPRPGIPIFSMHEKAVNRLGDGAAIGVIRYLAGQPLTSPQQVERILAVVRMAYAAPEVISSDADREPKATLLLLAYVNCSAISMKVKKVSAETERTRAYVIKQIEEYKRKLAPNKS